MTKDKHKTKVLFVWHGDSDNKDNNEVLALFPNEPYNHLNEQCMCYAHIGQHGGACYSLTNNERATEPEYKELKAELETLGYNLEVLNK